MKPKLVLFVVTFLMCTCVGELRFEVPSRPRLVVSGILIGVALISLALSARQTPKEVSDVR